MTSARGGQLEAIIRPAESSDIAVLEASWDGGGWFAERVSAATASAGLIVAFIEGLPVAHLDLRSAPFHDVVRESLPPCHEVNAMLVHDPALRSCGLGSEMLRFAESRCAVAGVERIGLAVALDNPRARHLYQRSGFELALAAFNPYGRAQASHEYLVKRIDRLPLR